MSSAKRSMRWDDGCIVQNVNGSVLCVIEKGEVVPF